MALVINTTTTVPTETIALFRNARPIRAVREDENSTSP
jgi:hypothetical protein